MSFFFSNRTSGFVAACLAAATLAGPMELLAAESDAPFDADMHAFAGGVTLDQAVAQAEKRYNARVVNTETVQVDGKTVYALRLLSADGHVTDIRVDAATGAVL